MPKKWEFVEKEEHGAMPDKVWVTDGVRTALFKPDEETGTGTLACPPESQCEFETYKIAVALSIPCAEIEIVNLFGKTGTLSYNFKTAAPSVSYISSADLFSDNGKVTLRSHTDSGRSLKLAGDITMSVIRSDSKFANLEKDAVNMAFLDCLVKNVDRHGGNWEIMYKNGVYLGIAPLFDHGNAFRPAFYADTALFLWEKDKSKSEREQKIPHYEMFTKLTSAYPEQILVLLQKSEQIELPDFCVKRLEEMRKIYAENTVKNQNPPSKMSIPPDTRLDSVIMENGLWEAKKPEFSKLKSDGVIMKCAKENEHCVKMVFDRSFRKQIDKIIGDYRKNTPSDGNVQKL